MKRRPPMSTRVPDTTTFGARLRVQAPAGPPQCAQLPVRQHALARRHIRREQRRALARQRVRRDPARRLGVGEEDRKSTRLNSSHANISYAVFCLNTKTNTPL